MAVPEAEPSTRLTPGRWALIQEIFHATAGCPIENRAAFLDAACAGDPRLRTELSDLLAAEGDATDFLASAVRGALMYVQKPDVPASPSFTGTGRFHIRQLIGSGGFGAVYEAFDRDQNAVVALKVLHNASAAEISGFKREFRSLADISHPNLISLYELLSEDGHWFFTMERVDGAHFLDALRPGDARPDFEKLRNAIAQLASGVCALHEFGKLHRDLKPSNVLVTAQGRVVIVDFGLTASTNFDEPGIAQAAGTPAYMAPEQFSQTAASPAADWYSVGVMLFEALTGCLPFTGSLLETMAAKLSSDPPAPCRFDPAIPADLDSLCRGLLCREPAMRPCGHDVLRFLAVEPSPVLESPFVGRQAHLDCLREALKTGGATGDMIYVSGPSGSGKTALVRQFLAEARRDHDVLSLSGRCYEQESVPYNAFDELVDALVAHLHRLPVAERSAFINPDTALAARLFPALLPFAPPAVGQEIQSHEVRQSAFAAFRSLLNLIATHWRVILHIDDLHWANTDSLQLLGELTRPPATPGLLLILCLRAAPAPLPERAILLRVDRLTPEECTELTSLLLPPALTDREVHAARIVRESHGNAYILTVLAQHATTFWHLRSLGFDSVDEIVSARVSALPAPVRNLLEVVVAAGQPVDFEVAWNASGQAGAHQAALSLLRAHRLIQMRLAGGRPEIETYHDGIRQAVQKSLQPEVLAARHHALAQELESSGRGSPESLALHFQTAGDLARAFPYCTTAGDKAVRALAFETAIRFYRMADDFSPGRELRRKLADALSSAGRGPEAAAMYSACAEGASPIEQIELRRLAATELLVSGHAAQGLEALKAVLETVGMKLPATAAQALPALLFHRAQLLLRGMEFRKRPGMPASAWDLARLDACWSVARGLGMVDTFRAVDFHTRYLLESLRLGDPDRIALGLGIEAGYSALSGSRSRRRTHRVLLAAGRLAEEIGKPHAIGLTQLATGVAAFLEGRWSDARRSLESAETFLREHCSGVAWELSTDRLMHCVSLFFLGEVQTLSGRLPALLEKARARGDLYESTDLEIRVAHAVHLAADHPEAAQTQIRQAMERWPAGVFYLQHWWAMIVEIEIALYRGDAGGAWERCNSVWSTLRWSLLMRVQYIRIESFSHRASAALALAVESPSRRKSLLQIALAAAGRIERENTAWGNPLARLIRAGAASIAGDTDGTLSHFAAAAVDFDAAGMKLYAAAARRAGGQWAAGETGRTEVADADAWMASQEIRNPEAIGFMLAPGRSGR